MKRTLIVILLATTGVFVHIRAQSDLQISKAFEMYGHQKGAVMVELTNEVFGNYNFTLFKSLSVSKNPQVADFIRKCLAHDESGARKVKQVVANGVPTSVYLQLPKKGKLFRLILFNEATQADQKVTLIYIESENDSEDVLKFILKRK